MSTSLQSGSMEKIPPHNLEAEMAVLGSVLVDSDLVDLLLAEVSPSDFYAHVHETIWTAIGDLHNNGKPIDKISVCEWLRARGTLDKVGGPAYFSALMETVQTAGSAKYYATIVREKATLRGLIRAGLRITEVGFEGEEDVADSLAIANRHFNEIIDRAAARTTGYNLRAAAEHQRASAAKRGTAAYLTPWPRLNKLIGGFVGGEVVPWASDPGLGKSFALNMLTSWTAWKYGHVALFATEMGVDETFMRLVALYSGVSIRRQREHALIMQGEKIDARPLTEFELDRIEEVKHLLEFLPITLFGGRIGVDDVVAQCRKLHRQEKLHAIVIDTLGKLVSATPRLRGESKHEVQERVVDTLKFLAEELDVPVHIAHHLNRKDRQAGRPGLENLRDGGNIEGTATTVVFLYEEKLNGGFIQPMFIVGKARNGSKGDLPMNFLGQRSSWLEQDQLYPPWIDQPPEQDVLDFDSLNP